MASCDEDPTLDDAAAEEAPAGEAPADAEWVPDPDVGVSDPAGVVLAYAGGEFILAVRVDGGANRLLSSPDGLFAATRSESAFRPEEFAAAMRRVAGAG